MGKCSKDKKTFQITLHKETIKVLDGAIDALNKEINPEKEKHVTRSIFIENMLQAVFVGALQVQHKIEKRKGGKKDA